MILQHILDSGQIGSGQKKDISDLSKMLFETYVPAASTLNEINFGCKKLDEMHLICNRLSDPREKNTARKA